MIPSQRLVRVLCVAAICVILLLTLNINKYKNAVINWNQTTSNVTLVSLVVTFEDGQVRDCLTGEIRGTGIKGLVGNIKEYSVADIKLEVDSKAVGTGEDRNRSMNSFQQIFNKRIWTQGRKKGVISSGGGSSVDYAVNTMLGLHTIIAEIKARHGLKRVRILDVPCGDMAWMSRFLSTRDDVDYVGIDIVPELIESHQKTYATQRYWKFRHYDIIRDGLTEQFDIIHCRMMLQHLVTNDVLNFLLQLSKSGSRYLLTTTFPHAARNEELRTSKRGRFRFLNLEVPPVSLTQPLCFFRDGPDLGNQHFHALWKLPLQRVQRCSIVNRLSFTGTYSKNIHYACGNWSV